MKNRWLLLVALLLLCPIIVSAATIDQVNGQVKAYLRFVELRKPANPNMGQIRELYNEKLVAVIKDATKLVPGLKVEVDQYLLQAEKNQVKLPYLQGVEKNMQFAFAQLMDQQLNLAEKNFKTKTALNTCKLAKAYYGGIDSTAIRRGEFVGSPNLFSDQFKYAFEVMEKAIADKDQKTVTIAKNQIILLNTKVYFLGVLYELEGLAANRGKNENVVHEKMVEGKTFFKIIKNAAKDAKAAATIEAEFNKSGAELNITVVKENLQIAYPELSVEFKGKF